MAEVFGYVADHAEPDMLPSAGGNRPHLNIHIRWEDLQAQARAAMLDFGGQMTPAAARMACCDACVIPIVMDGAGQPFDVGGHAAHHPRPHAPRGRRPGPRLRPPRLRPHPLLG